jgi:hypothetical protein
MSKELSQIVYNSGVGSIIAGKAGIFYPTARVSCAGLDTLYRFGQGRIAGI